jgi:hypothetical protein
MLLGAKRAWKMLSRGFAPAAGVDAQTPGRDEENGIVLANTNHRLAFDPKTARLVSLKAGIAPDQEFVLRNDQLPVFVIQYLNGEKQFQQIASTEAKEVIVKSDARTLTAEFTGLGGLDLAATVTVRLEDNDP